MEISRSDKPLSLKRVFLLNLDISILESQNFHFGNDLTIKTAHWVLGCVRTITTAYNSHRSRLSGEWAVKDKGIWDEFSENAYSADFGERI
jgi:hypothetical protein